MTTGPVPLAYTEWTLVELEGESVEVAESGQAPSLVLDLEEARVTGSGGVNRLTGSFALSCSIGSGCGDALGTHSTTSPLHVLDDVTHVFGKLR